MKKELGGHFRKMTLLHRGLRISAQGRIMKLAGAAEGAHLVDLLKRPRGSMPGFLLGVTLLAAFLLICPGCGYHFSGEGLGPRPELRKIAIPVFENNTSEAGLEGRFTAALRDEFILRSQFQLVPVEEAEVIFHGRITNISTSRVAQRGVQQTIESRLFITVNIRCVEVKTGNVIWQDPQFTYYRTFSLPGSGADPALLYENRRRAEEFLAQEMAVRIHDRFLANF